MIKKHKKSNRLHGYNYSQPGVYYITICTKHRKHYFGDIHNGIMCVNRLGAIAWRQWEWLGQQYNHIRLHAYVVMPNHIHGILEIIDQTSVGTGRDLSLQRDLDMHNGMNIPERQNNKIKSLSELIGAYKTTTSKLIHQIPFASFSWQRSFHDHIIKKERSLYTIREYIIQNPAMWEKDCFNT